MAHNLIVFSHIYVSLFQEIFSSMSENDFGLAELDRIFSKYGRDTNFESSPNHADRNDSEDVGSEDAQTDSDESPTTDAGVVDEANADSGTFDIANVSLTRQETSSFISKLETKGLQIFEDITSDETIQKIKNLPINLMKQQVVMLTAEKKKWDTSIFAAVRIGCYSWKKDSVSLPPKKCLLPNTRSIWTNSHKYLIPL
jgi:hypothetical protein